MTAQIYAFPSQELDKRGLFKQCHSGMSLRDYFAAAAMQAYLTRDEYDFSMPYVITTLTREVYFVADAMMRERTKEVQP